MTEIYDRTLVIIKPDAIRRGVHGEMIRDLLNAGFSIHRLVTANALPSQIDAHYAEHLEKGFYPQLRQFMLTHPIMVMIVEGASAQPRIREWIGPTDPQSAHAVDHLRGKYRDASSGGSANLIHASDSPISARREISIWFGDTE